MERIIIEIEIQDDGQTSMQKINSDLQVMLKSMAVCKFNMVGQDKKISYEKGNMENQ